jgi:hypothetical protein
MRSGSESVVSCPRAPSNIAKCIIKLSYAPVPCEYLSKRVARCLLNRTGAERKTPIAPVLLDNDSVIGIRVSENTCSRKVGE